MQHHRKALQWQGWGILNKLNYDVGKFDNDRPANQMSTNSPATRTAGQLIA
jgi:hypothetical protein